MNTETDPRNQERATIRDKAIETMRSAIEAYNKEVEKYNDAVSEAYDKLSEAYDDLEGAALDAEDMIFEVHDESYQSCEVRLSDGLPELDELLIEQEDLHAATEDFQNLDTSVEP